MNSEDLKLAKCKINAVPTAMFFEEFEKLSFKNKRKIISICESCGVKDKCLSDAMSKKDTYGVWGGVFFKKGRPVRVAAGRKKDD
jgi:hypothetical protein